jgi:DNA-binding response OmpR family regulator
MGDTIIHFGKCRLDTVKQTLIITSGQHSLSFKESALLEMMIANKNNVLKR